MSDGGPHVEFASAILVDTEGRFLFQQRDDIPGIRNPGMIGLFGGHREAGETFAECVSREVHEEIGYLVSPGSFEKMADYSAADRYGTLSGEFFIAYGVPVDALSVTEGSLMIATRGELPALIEKLEPSARTAVRIYLNNK